MAICDVLCESARIENWFLRDYGDVTAELLDVVGTDVGAVEGYFAGGGIVKAEKEGAYVSVRRLSGEGRGGRGRRYLWWIFRRQRGRLWKRSYRVRSQK